MFPIVSADHAQITDQEVQEFVDLFVRGFYRDCASIDQEQALSVMRAILRRVVGEQITAIECLGGLGAWSRDSLSKLLSDAAEIEMTQVFGVFSQAFASAMQEQTQAAPSSAWN
jgi:hypothetical protein